MKKSDSGTGILLLISILLTLPLAAWSGFAIHELWGWFVVPLGVGTIGVWQGAGLYLLVRMLSTAYTAEMNTELLAKGTYSATERLLSSTILLVLAPAMALLFGLIYHALGG